MPIDEVISKLGYAESKNLIYFRNNLSDPLTLHDKKMISELKPYAYYLVDNKPFILFYERQLDRDITVKEISRPVWNAQIPIAIFCDDNAVRVFNGTSIDAESRCISEIKSIPLKECDEESDFSFWNISNPLFWEKYSKAYSQDRLNQSLLDNISYLTDQLHNKYNIEFATKLVLRLIFIRYLIDRGIDLDYEGFGQDIEESQKQFLEILSNKGDVYDFFVHLKTKFNGNLFELGNEIESKNLTDDVFRLLQSFFAGDEKLENGQYCLFRMYDFNLIPIELISNIYEILLGENGREKDNAFYTPNYLVEYILDNVTNSTLKEKKQFSVLDPACGSGVFLVNSYRRIVEEFLDGEQYCKDDELLQRLLIDNIFGVDINDAAVDVTIFSLYLTVLDYKNPKTLKSFKLPDLKERNLFVCDFFDEEKLEILNRRHFDFIIGNPPWGNVKTGMHMSYCKEHGYDKMQQNNEICRSFVFRAQDFTQDESTTCCFILHSKILYNKKQPAVNFRHFLLTKTRILDVLEMSGVRKQIFEHADAPAVVLSFQYVKESVLENNINYISMKPNHIYQLFHIIMIERNDVKIIQQRLLYSYDWAWKAIVYGSSSDIETIIKLKSTFVTLNEAIKKQIPKIIKGAGVEYQDGDLQDARHLVGKRMLDSKKGVDHFYIKSENTTIFEKMNIHRVRKEKLFVPPYVLCPTGVDCTDYRLRAAYTEDEFVAKKTMYIFKGERENYNFLHNLSGLLNSSFYAYLNLMLGSSIGIEREQRFMDEVLQYPYVYSDKIVNLAIEAKKKAEIECTHEVDTNENDTEILKLFEVSNSWNVDYILNVQIPDLTGAEGYRVNDKVNEDDLRNYCKCFFEHFTTIYNRAKHYIHISLHPLVGKAYTVMELSISDNKDEQGIFVYDDVDSEKTMLSKFGVYTYNEKFYQMRDVFYFSSNSFYIIKPNRYKYWHPAMAEIDLADVMDQIMNADGGVEL